jgi:hypothetical protein
MVAADNARPHTAAESQHFMAPNGMVIIAHLPDAPDLAPSDFYLFGHVKALLRGESLKTGENRYRRERAFWTLSKVFIESVTRLERNIESDGD